VVKYFGAKWKELSPERRAKLSEDYTKQLGISGDDLAALSGGKLRLDQIDRLTQLLGPKAGESRMASKIYWGLMEDMRQSTDPMVQGVLKAKSVQRQSIAANDIAQMVRPAADSLGRPQVAPASLRKLSDTFRNFDRDPSLLKWDERLMVESIPASQRQPFLSFIDEVFKTKEGVKQAGEAVKSAATAAKAKITPKPVPKPVLTPERLPHLPDDLGLKPLEYTRGKGAFGAEYAAGRVAGLGIPAAILGAFGINWLAGKVFEAGLTPNGRSFVRQLYSNEPVSLSNTAKIMALTNYLNVARQAEDQRHQIQMMQGAPQ